MGEVTAGECGSETGRRHWRGVRLPCGHLVPDSTGASRGPAWMSAKKRQLAISGSQKLTIAALLTVREAGSLDQRWTQWEHL